jgi:hypothetical protein
MRTRKLAGQVHAALVNDEQIKQLNPVLLFALRNLHRMPVAYEPDTWAIAPQSAPSQEAWNMLTLAARDPKQFMGMISKELLAIDAEERKHKREMDKKEWEFERALQMKKELAKLKEGGGDGDDSDNQKAINASTEELLAIIEDVKHGSAD